MTVLLVFAAKPTPAITAATSIAVATLPLWLYQCFPNLIQFGSATIGKNYLYQNQ